MSGTRATDRRLRLESLETRQMLAFSIGTNFTAGSFPFSGFLPPDTMGTVGPNHIVELINGRAAAYDKNGVLLIAATLDQFWINAGVTPAGAFSFDPRVLYDAASGRFFAAAVDNPGGANNFLVAVSDSSDPTAGWTGFQIDSDADDSHWADFPMLGLDNNVITISANMFGLGGQSTTTSFLVIPKNDLLAAAPTVGNATLFENLSLNDTGFAPQPIVDLDNGNLPLPILSAYDKPGGSLKTSGIGGTPSAPTLNTAGGLIAVTPRGLPADIDQPGPKEDIDVGDHRFGGNVVQQQIPGRTNPSLWGVHSVDIGGRAALEWYEIDAVTNALLQSGTIADPSLAFNYPSIAVNDFGDVVVGFSGGDPTTFMSTYVAVGQTFAGVTTFDPVTQTHAGVADYELLDGIGRNRWGDYSSTVLDPTSQQRFWTFQEFASGTDEWSVRVTEIVILSGISIGDDVTVFEGDSGTTDAVFVVALADPVGRPVTVFYTTVDVTAVAPGDYETQSGTLTFLPGAPLAQSVTITVVGELIVESNETFLVTLSGASGAVLGRSTAIGTILNDDIDLVINDLTISEGHSGTRDAVFTVSAVGVVNRTLTITYTTLNGSATSADDYLPRAGVLTIAPGTSTALVTVTVLGDTLNEGNHSFFVLLYSAVGARIADASGTGTIIDDDLPPAIYVNDVQVTGTSGNNLFAVFTVALGPVSGQNVTVAYATSDGDAHDGVDYLGTSGLLTFTPGVTTRQVSVQIIVNAAPGTAPPNKSFFLNLGTLSNAIMGDAQGIGTIVFAPGPVGELIVDNGDAGYTHTAGWTTVTNTLAFGLDYASAPAGNGSAKATYAFNGLANGSYQVYTRWIPFSNRATNAVYTILDDGTAVGTATVNQQAAPAGDLSNGVIWQSLGIFTTTTGNLSVRLANNANGYVIADAVRLVPNGIPPQVSEMNVSGSSQSIGTGDPAPTAADGTEFGSVNVNGNSSAHTFTITNTGNVNLTLTGNPPVVLTGDHPGDFIVTKLPSAVIPPGGTTTFEITFHPTTADLRKAVVSIANNDNTEQPYTFAVQGTGVQAVVQPLAHNDAFPQDVNGDALVTPNDALIVINTILSGAAPPQALALAAQPLAAATTFYVDVNADGKVSPADLLMVINYILSAPQALAPTVGSSGGSAPPAAPAVDAAIVLFDDTADAAAADSVPQAAIVSSGPTATRSASVASGLLVPERVESLLAFEAGEESDGDEFDPVLLALGD